MKRILVLRRINRLETPVLVRPEPKLRVLLNRGLERIPAPLRNAQFRIAKNDFCGRKNLEKIAPARQWAARHVNGKRSSAQGHRSIPIRNAGFKPKAIEDQACFARIKTEIGVVSRIFRTFVQVVEV